MRVIVFGAGAIGGVIGGRLAQSGHDVVLIARGAHHDAIRADGLRLEDPDRTVTVSVPVVDGPAAITFGEDDVVVLAVKSQDSPDALRALAASASSTTPVVCAQNGVANERLALRSFANVHAMCVMCPATHLAPGIVQAHSAPTSGILDLGLYPGGVDHTSEDLAAVLRASTFSAKARTDIMKWKHRKLLSNLGNAIDAACGPGARGTDVAARARAEAEACLQVAGIEATSEADDRARRGELLSVRSIGSQRRGGSSSWQSLERGTGSIEADYLNGEIVLLGRLHGVPTPVNATLQRIANQMARERTAPGSLAVEDLVAAVS